MYGTLYTDGYVTLHVGITHYNMGLARNRWILHTTGGYDTLQVVMVGYTLG